MEEDKGVDRKRHNQKWSLLPRHSRILAELRDAFPSLAGIEKLIATQLAASGSSSFWLDRYEGASASDISLDFSDQQIDVIASGSSA